MNLPSLKEAMDSEKEEMQFPIFVCGCGDEGCAGSTQTPLIKNSGILIIWEIYQPQRYTFTFEKSQLKAEFKALQETLKKEQNLEFWQKCCYLATNFVSELLAN